MHRHVRLPVTPRRRVPCLLLAAAVLLAAWTTVSAVAPGSAEAATRLTKAERAVVKLINAERRKRGLRALRIRVSLCRAADRHSGDMLRRQYFAHRSADGSSVASRLRRAGYRSTRCARWSVGETLAAGSGAYAAPQMVVRMLLRSKPHRRVLLGRGWRDIGVGRRSGAFRGRSRVVLTTVDFGRRVTF